MICLAFDCNIDFLKGKKKAMHAVEGQKNNEVSIEVNRFEVLFGVYLERPQQP